MRRRLLIILASLLLVGVVVLASCGQYDPYSGTWAPTVATKLVTQVVIAKTQAGWEETTTYPDGQTSSFPLKLSGSNLLTPAVSEHGGFALWYYPKTDRLGLRSGGTPLIYLEKTTPPTTPVL